MRPLILYYVDGNGDRQWLPLEGDCNGAVIKAMCKVYGCVWVRC